MNRLDDLSEDFFGRPGLHLLLEVLTVVHSRLEHEYKTSSTVGDTGQLDFVMLFTFESKQVHKDGLKLF